MKNILITGASRGLGKHLAELLLSKGYYVYGTTRNPGHSPKKENFKLLYLDFCDKKSISDLVSYFIEANLSLDAIIHNAGVAYLDPIEVMAEEEYRQIFEVNCFGPIALTKGLIPILKKPKTSSLIYISSVVSMDVWPYLGAYAASKRAMEAIAFEWAMLLKHWNINVSIVQPNPLPTGMDIKRSKNANTSPYPELHNRCLEWESIEETIQMIYSILNAESPKFQYQTGVYSKEVADRLVRQEAYQQGLQTYRRLFDRYLTQRK